MNKQVFNPFLPSYEYIPDPEPYVFGDRVYIYGSHDRFNAKMFCVNDYVCWSAPVEDLSDWKCEGIIYKKTQDPKNCLGLRIMFAPDVVQGLDGRFYLYYAFDFMGIMGVAVSDSPAGQYEFLGHISYRDGTIWGRKKGDQLPFDPAVFIDDDGKIYLYSGFYTSVPAIASGFKKLKTDGGIVIELEQDMVTIKKDPVLLFPKEGKDSFSDHEFFEASSMRKINGKYYFVYSSKHNHELCYAVSDRPDGGFVYGGTLISLGDLFLEGNQEEEKGLNYLGNTHGGMVEIKGQWYIFYHRQTNRSSYSRQACAEALHMNQDGSFRQAEVTSCGLNNGPLSGKGEYEARIACNLWSKDGVGRYDCPSPKKRYAKHPYFTQEGKDRENNPDQYIANMRNKAVAGFKYFDIKGLNTISIRIRGEADGEMIVSVSKSFATIAAAIPIRVIRAQNWVNFEAEAVVEQGITALYFQYRGNGSIDFKAFELKSL
uniref:family 43 glycosylhydrolase n=1 Tax=Konateibacter massiliensis TaxID=2002841 RepID=UPI000C154F44|nr:family 43 glycosylhydrolase [Konateibacter massiliensis]